uniref:Uncharacterized protein n=1 Tax=Coscinodiscus granii TaxID=265552 RepID=A0A8A6W3E5_9STRA|nr:hypothetical protein LV970_mgp31 [Coscinodiscus granii]QTK21659.1 hypothetical protein [Coscinodiscus granii]
MLLNFYIKTKLKQKSKNIFTFFLKFLKKNFYDIFFFNFYTSKSKKYFLSLLKSHFVYKSSQEQLGYINFKNFFKLFSLKNFFFSWVLTKINLILFQSSFIKQFFTISFNYSKTFFIKTFIFNNFLLVSQLTNSFLKILDFYGETFLINPLQLKQ